MPIPHRPNAGRWMRKACSGGLAVALSVSTAWAYDLPPGTPPGFTAQIKGGETWTWDSNPLRLVHGGKSLQGSDTSAEMLLGDRTPRSQLSLDSLVDQGIYDNSAFNAANDHEALKMFTTNEHWLVGLDGHFDYDTTRTSEITSYGVAVPAVRHRGLSAAPQLAYEANAKDTYAINGFALESRYDNPSFVDYNFYSLAPSYTHRFDPLNSGILTLNAQRYETAHSPTSTVDSIGPSLGWQRIITQALTVRFTAGAEEENNNPPYGIHSSSRLNYVFSGNATYKGQQDTTTFTASRNEQPFGNGGSSLLTSFILKEAHAVNDKITLNAYADYRNGSYASSTATINLKDEISGSAGISYHLLTSLDLDSNYQYLHQTLTGLNGAVKEQIVTVSLNFHPEWGSF